MEIYFFNSILVTVKKKNREKIIKKLKKEVRSE
jgi:hypothetical protein